MSENYLYGTSPCPTNPIRILEVKILNALNGGAGGTGSGGLSGVGSPEGVVTANPGTTYLDDSGGFWAKFSGTGNTGWLQLIV